MISNKMIKEGLEYRAPLQDMAFSLNEVLPTSEVETSFEKMTTCN